MNAAPALDEQTLVFSDGPAVLDERTLVVGDGPAVLDELTLNIGDEPAELADTIPVIGDEPAELEETILVIGDDTSPKRRVRNRWRIGAWLVLGGIAGSFTLLMSVAIRSAMREHRREQCREQLHFLGLAFQEYNNKHRYFPTPAIVSPDGKPLLSWRVALLPQIGYQSLYERFRLDEPWDSPHNRTLWAEMPHEFACPAGPSPGKGRTNYRVIVGPENDGFSVNTAFAPGRGADIRHFTDGTSNTIMVLETDSFVPWTKPDDLHWSKGGALPALASPHPNGAHAVFADGATKFLKATIRPEILLALLTINGGEVISGGG
jgi:prepilin-type processing-associated H-X9-DG protein